MPHSEFDSISQFFKQKTFKKGEYLLSQGEVCNFFTFVEKGCLRFFTLNAEGQEFTRYFAFENKFGTALRSLITGEQSNESIQAIENSKVLTITKTDFFHLVKTNYYVNQVYLGILENAYITSQKRIYNLQSENALDRLKWLINSYPDILNRLPSKYIASYVGVTPFTLSRLKSEI